jgi:hypothetical protein
MLVRVSALLFMFLTGNAFAANEGRGVDPVRFSYGNSPAFRGILEGGQDGSSAFLVTTDKLGTNAPSEIRVAMWRSSDLPASRSELLSPTDPTPLRISALPEIVPLAAPTEMITAKEVPRVASHDSTRHRHVSKGKHWKRQARRSARRVAVSKPPVTPAVPSWGQKMFDGLF